MRAEVSSTIESILSTAEADLRAIIEDCLAANSYREMAIVAGIADGVSSLRKSVYGEATTPKPDGRDTTTAIVRGAKVAAPDASVAVNSPNTTSRRAQKPSEYPRFEREGERLVKIGWSKKDRAAYEHKAPITAVVATGERLRAQPKAFTMDQILPLRDETGADVPSYQVYLVVAWLRQLGLVERNGNDGYTTLRDKLSDDAVQEAWLSLPARR